MDIDFLSTNIGGFGFLFLFFFTFSWQKPTTASILSHSSSSSYSWWTLVSQIHQKGDYFCIAMDLVFCCKNHRHVIKSKKLASRWRHLIIAVLLLLLPRLENRIQIDSFGALLMKFLVVQTLNPIDKIHQNILNFWMWLVGIKGRSRFRKTGFFRED